MLNRLTAALGILAGLMHVAAFVLYNIGTFKGKIRPTVATWILWVVLSTINCVTYVVMTGDWQKGALSVASTVSCIGTFCFVLFIGKFGHLTRTEWKVAAIGLVSVLVWWIFRNATYGNLLLQIAIAVSFVPTFQTVRRDASAEKPLPWMIWSSAYILMLAVVFLRWRDQYQDLAYPINCLILHGGVGLLATRRNS